MSLHNSQELFSRVLDLKHAGESRSAENFSALLQNNEHLPTAVAIDIYRNNSIGVRQRALQIIYPVTEEILGEQCFALLANEYATASPSLNSDLNAYGQDLPGFIEIQVQKQPAFADFTYLPELARLEWLYHAVFYVADDDPVAELPVSSAAANTEKTLSLQLSRALFTLRTASPVYEIWKNHQQEKGGREVAALTEEDYLVVFRRQGKPEMHRISHGEWTLLQILVGVRNVEWVISRALEKDIDVQQVLPAMIEKGWIQIQGLQTEAESL